MAEEEVEAVWPILEKDYEEVVVHLRNNFFPDEPLNRSVALVAPGLPHHMLEDLTLTTLADQLSVMAFDTANNKVAAVCLNGVLKEGDLEASLEKVNASTDEKFKTIFGFLYGVNLELDLFNKYRTKRVFESRILSVDKEYRGKGLAYMLIEKSEQVARNSGFKVFKSDLTGLFSQKVFTKSGFETIYEVKYEDHRDENGEVVFKTDPPHESLKIMVKILD